MNRELEGKVSFRRGSITTSAQAVSVSVRNVTATADTITSADKNNTVTYTTAATETVVSIPVSLGEAFRFRAINLTGGNIVFQATATGVIAGDATATDALWLQNSSGRNRIDFEMAATQWFTSDRTFMAGYASFALGDVETFAHHLGARPRRMFAWLQNTTSGDGWALGEEVIHGVANTSGSSAGTSIWLHSDTTNCYAIAPTAARIIAKDGSANAVLSATEWSLAVYAEV